MATKWQKKTLRFLIADKPKKSKQPAAEAPPPPVETPKQRVVELRFPESHPFSQLWSMYSSRVKRPPEPSVRFDELLTEDGAVIYKPETLAPELPRLEMLLTSSARRRLNKTSIPGAEGLDAQIVVFVPVDKLAAWVMMYPPVGSGVEVTYEMLAEALGKSKVTFGIDETFLRQLVTSKERYFRLTPVARGVPPVHGEDGCVIDAFSRSDTREMSYDENGDFDFHSADLFQNVRAGDVICNIIPPKPCKDGVTVTNEVAYASAGHPATVEHDRNTEMNEDGSALLATCDGHVEYGRHGFTVKPVMDISGDVDVSTGNVSCVGDLHIRGDVRSGVTVRATGSVTIDGVVESSTVEAGADLIVRKGVQGNNHAVLRARQGIYAKYLESTSVFVFEKLESECLINCEIYSDGTVNIRSGRGKILGGRIRAAKEICANTVGARSEMKTEIFLGGRPCEEYDRTQLVKRISELENESAKISRQSSDPLVQQRLAKIRVQISACKMKLRKVESELDLTEETRARMMCSVLHPGTEITIGTETLQVRLQEMGCNVSLTDEGIVLH